MERRTVAELFFSLIQEFPAAEASFIFHGLRFHRRFELGLA
jgi:hypothetical protein